MLSTKSSKLAISFIGQTLVVTIDRQMGSRHPKHGFIYPINYGYIEGLFPMMAKKWMLMLSENLSQSKASRVLL